MRRTVPTQAALAVGTNEGAAQSAAGAGAFSAGLAVSLLLDVDPSDEELDEVARVSVA